MFSSLYLPAAHSSSAGFRDSEKPKEVGRLFFFFFIEVVGWSQRVLFFYSWFQMIFFPLHHSLIYFFFFTSPSVLFFPFLPQVASLPLISFSMHFSKPQTFFFPSRTTAVGNPGFRSIRHLHIRYILYYVYTYIDKLLIYMHIYINIFNIIIYNDNSCAVKSLWPLLHLKD